MAEKSGHWNKGTKDEDSRDQIHETHSSV